MCNSNYPLGVHGGMDYFNGPPDPPECRECGAEFDLDWDYCPFCGAEINWRLYPEWKEFEDD